MGRNVGVEIQLLLAVNAAKIQRQSHVAKPVEAAELVAVVASLAGKTRRAKAQ